MKHAVIGCGFGDEGKGVVTDWLASHFHPSSALVVRYSGGHQAGHTVTIDGVSHVFANFGSGTMRGTPTYWSKHCTVSPTGLWYEFAELKNKKINPVLYINKDCPVTTPYDKLYNNNSNEIRNHGTCGVGFGSTLEREENHYHLHYGDLAYPSIVEIKMNAIEQYYKNRDKRMLDSIDKHNLQCSIVNFYEHCRFAIANFEAVNEMSYYENTIYEGSQGLMLDQDIGFFPHVTRSNVGYKRLKDLNIDCYHLVTRAYQTRHGNGPMSNEKLPHNIIDNPKETNVYNSAQGHFRKALLDVDFLQYGIEKDNTPKDKSILYITCLEHVKNEHRFTYKGDIINCSSEKDFVSKIKNILDIKTVRCVRMKKDNILVEDFNKKVEII